MHAKSNSLKMTFHDAILFAILVCCVCFGAFNGENWEPCGLDSDWIQYNDEKCFKILDHTLQTFDEAKEACGEQDDTSTLVVIHSSEEQHFLSNYLFKTEQKVENFWIGAKYSSQNGSFVWIDNSPFDYANWDAIQSQRNQENHCVHMQADERVAGKWKDGRCGKKNAVVCQKTQFWTIDLLQKTFLDSRKQQRDTIQNLTQSLENANKRIVSLENVEQKIKELKLSFENGILNANQRINELQKNEVPIGFIYVQLPHQSKPKALWPTAEWKDVTSTFDGAFFRTEGKDAAQFGTVQPENVPKVTQVRQAGELICSEHDWKWDSTTLNVGGWSSGIGVYSGKSGHAKNDRCSAHQFFTSGGEVRPRNMAIRVWKRIS